MNRYEYTRQVVGVMRHVTAAEITAIREELEGHIEDRALALMETGCTEEEAERYAIDAMGDAEEVGRGLQKQYPLGWLVAWRAVTVAIVWVALCAFLFSFLGGYRVLCHVQARFYPRSHMSGSHAEWCTQDLDIRINVGSDQVYIYGAGTNAGKEGTVRLYASQYDRWPLGYLSRHSIAFETEDGERLRGGGYSESGGVRYTNWEFELPPGTDHIYAVAERYGEVTRVEVPLYWEVRE